VVGGTFASIFERGDDKAFDPWRVPASPHMAAVVAAALSDLDQYERAHTPRKRARRDVDQASHEAIVTALICDLAYQHLAGRKGGIFITRSRTILASKSRYKAPVLTTKFPDVVEALAAPQVALARQFKGQVGHGIGAKSTTLKPTPKLTERLADLDVSDIGTAGHPELIWLRDKRVKHDEPGEAIEYDDTPTTERYRAEVYSINEWLAGADIEFDDSILPVNAVPPDLTRRALRRIFTNASFDSGGRLEGGFWLPMKDKHRLEGISIGGESVVSLDYGQIGPRIVYGLAGTTAPEGDLYYVPGLERWRSGVKDVINAALFSAKPLERRPMHTSKKLPEGAFHHIMRTIEEAHAPLARQFGRGMGHQAQFLESQVMVRTLLDLKEQEVVALPIHDAIIVSRSRAEVAARAMQGAFEGIVGGHIPVTSEAWCPRSGSLVTLPLS
jgi:hypothetical protein